MNKERVIGLVLFLAAKLILILYVLKENVWDNLQFFWSDIYFAIVYFALLIGAVLVFISPKIPQLRKYTRYVYFIIFIPVAVFPMIRCFFKVPYIFCHICPRQCPWGQLSKATIPVFLAMNFDCRFWCYNLCPLGSVQDYQSTVCKARLKWPEFIRHVRYLILAGVVFALSAVFFADARFRFLFNGEYMIGKLTIIFFLIVILLSFCIPRLWCRYFCPIGTVGDICLKIRKKKQCDIRIDDHKDRFKQKDS